jgi:hypothetical protein
LLIAIVFIEREQGYRSSGLSGDEDGGGKKKKKKKGTSIFVYSDCMDMHDGSDTQTDNEC